MELHLGVKSKTFMELTYIFCDKDTGHKMYCVRFSLYLSTLAVSSTSATFGYGEWKTTASFFGLELIVIQGNKIKDELFNNMQQLFEFERISVLLRILSSHGYMNPLRVHQCYGPINY